MPDFAARDPSNLLLGQWSGRFAEAGDQAGIACYAKGRGALIADFNLDGTLDILQIDRGSNVALFRNLGAKNGDGEPLPMGNWTEIRLVEPDPNRDAVGAKIAVKTGTRTQTRVVQVGGGDDPDTRAGSMWAWAQPSGRRSACNGRTASGARPTGCSPTRSSSSTAQSRKPPTGIRGGEGGTGLSRQ